jgi:two-component system, cell cycle sensor histidine kinase and response regulator CckA
MNKPEPTQRQFVPTVQPVGQRAGIWRLVLLGFILAAGAAALFVFGRDNLGEPAMLAALGGLAAIGVFFLFAMLLGFVQVSAQRSADLFAKNLVDNMDAGLVVNDRNGRVVYANRAYAELLGARSASEVGSVEAVFSRRNESADIVYRMANAARRGEAAVEEFRLPTGLRSGEEGARWFRMRVRSMSVPGIGNDLNVWQVSDITSARRRQENAFQELQNAINYLDHAPAGFIASEENGSIVYVNATLADWLGIDLAQFEPGSRSLRDLVIGDGIALLDAARPTGGPTVRTSVIDLDLARSDGKSLPARLYHRVAASLDGAPGTARTVVLNRMLGDTEGDGGAEIRFTRFFNNTPMAIGAIGADGSIHRTNAPFQRMFKPIIDSKGGLSNLNFIDLAGEGDSKPLADALASALEGQAQIDPVDVTIGGGRFFRFFVSAVDRDGGFEGGGAGPADNDDRAIVYAMDMTEQRELEEQFTQSQKMQAVGQLAGGVAHDFNNVLTAIIGFSDLLLANHRPSDPSFQDIMNIKQNANRAASLVRQLLAFSRRQTLRPQVLHLGDVLSDLRMLLDRLLGEKIDLKVIHGRDLWPIRADLSQFEQVIVNLAVNARDAMADGGRLTIRTSNVEADEIKSLYSYKEMPAGDYVLVEVEDEGVGMSGEVIEKIFEPFFSTKEVGKGTGLGLSTVYGIIKQTGGYIYPESEVGKGTNFRVFLPRHGEEAIVDDISGKFRAAPQDDDAEPEAAAEVPPKDLTGSATLLLVEDEDAVRAFASRALISRGYTVHEASTGAEALEVMAEAGVDFDLVISDVVMPEMDGPTLFTELRRDYPDLKFIFMSGYAEEAFAKNLPDNDRYQFGFLPKPFTLKQLATTVKEILES